MDRTYLRYSANYLGNWSLPGEGTVLNLSASRLLSIFTLDVYRLPCLTIDQVQCVTDIQPEIIIIIISDNKIEVE